MKCVQRNFIASGAMLLLATQAQAITGNEYRALNETQRQAWLVGALDGILTAQLTLTSKQPPLVICLADLEATQQRAIFEKALESDPERWHFPAAFSLLSTFNGYCKIK